MASGLDALADVAGGFRDAYAELLDGVGQARARLLGFSLYLLAANGCRPWRRSSRGIIRNITHQ